MSEPWQLFFHANLMAFPRFECCIIFIHERPAQNREIGKRRKEFIISFIISKDYFTFPAFTSVNNNKEYMDFNGENQL